MLEALLKIAVRGYRKKGVLLTALAIIMVLTAGCAALTPADQPEVDFDSPTLYGAIQTPFAGFRRTVDVPREDYPVQFTANGKIGFKDKSGKVIVQPTYSMVHEFWQGVGRGRIDNPDGSFTWEVFDLNGNIYDYTDVMGFHYGLSPVKKDDHYGYINQDGELVVPLQYDELFNSYINADEEDYRSAYGLKDGKMVYLNLKDGYEEVYEKYDPAKKDAYKRYIDVKDYALAVANDMLVVNGQSDPNGVLFPLTILEGLDFELFNQNGIVGTFQAKLTRGIFEGEVFIYFPGYSGVSDSGTFAAENNPGQYFAVPAGFGLGYREVSAVARPEQYKPAVNRYLQDKGIGKAPVAITKTLQADFDGDGGPEALLEINDTYSPKDGSEPLPMKEEWTENDFAARKTAFVNAILIIDDLSEPSEYRIIKSNIRTNADWKNYFTESIGTVGNFDADEEMELLIFNGYYEYADYAIVDLGLTNAYYPSDTAGVVNGVLIREQYEIQEAIRERELQEAMFDKRAELFGDGHRQTQEEFLTEMWGMPKENFSAEQLRYLGVKEAGERLLTPNEAFNQVMREEALYQEALKRGYLVTAQEAERMLRNSDASSLNLMSGDPENKKNYEALLGYEQELLAAIGFDHDSYWYWYHAPLTARSETINRLRQEFGQKVQEKLYPGLADYPLWIKQENLWQDYAEYLLQEKNAQAVSAEYTLEFSGEAWTCGELFN